MRAASVTALALLLLAPLRGEEALLARRKLEAGMYVWEGVAETHFANPLPDSVAAMDRAGFHAMRLLLSQQAVREYGVPPLRCPGGGRPTLTCLLRSDAYRAALAVKSVDTVMFTAYDFASFQRQRFLDPEFLKTNRQQVFDEYRDLAEAIMLDYSGSGRVFLIGHWEGDNQVYCGSSYDYETVAEKHNACVKQDPGSHLLGLAEWLRIRQEAIAEGRRRAIEAGAANVEVWHAVEFNTLFRWQRVEGSVMRQKDYRGVLDTLVPLLHPDVCSYSAWESVARGRLTKDLQDVRKVCGTAPVIVGELGDKENPDKHYKKIVSALLPLRESVPLVFFWQAFESGAPRQPGFGLFDVSGTPRHAKALEAIRSLLGGEPERRK